MVAWLVGRKGGTGHAAAACGGGRVKVEIQGLVWPSLLDVTLIVYYVLLIELLSIEGWLGDGAFQCNGTAGEREQ